MTSNPFVRAPHAQSRFELLLKIASGGMGTVYLGQQRGAAGFQRLVAIKRAHPHLLEDASIVKTLVMEAHLASLVRHPNVVGVIDVEDAAGELLLVMEYVEGASLSEVNAAPRRLPIGMAIRIILDACEGLQALHSARDDEGAPLGMVHRDVSPQNILIGMDGLARIADLGIARAYAMHTSTSVVRGKPGYLAPEYLRSGRATPRTDVFALGVVAWETLTRQRLARTALETDAADPSMIAPPSAFRAAIPQAVDDAILKAIERSPQNRYATVRDFAEALEEAARPALEGPQPSSRVYVAQYISDVFGPKLRARRDMLRESTPASGVEIAFDELEVPDATPSSMPTKNLKRELESATTAPVPAPPRSRIVKTAAAGVVVLVVAALALSTALGIAQMRSEPSELGASPANSSHL